ncbi:DUF1588 domain-containing protein [bacterium]|nr:DUF1588 domain-containing protein [bacterium]
MCARQPTVNGEPDPVASSANTDDCRFQPQPQVNVWYSLTPEHTFSACHESERRLGTPLSIVNAFVSQLSLAAAGFVLLSWLAPNSLRADQPLESFGQHCIGCHSGTDSEGNFDLDQKLKGGAFDATLVFENIATEKMPPTDTEVLTVEKRQDMLTWLAEQQPESKPIPFRRISRHEFVHSVNDLLGTNIDLSGHIPVDRGTRSFDSDRRIGLSRQMLGSYFAVADEMLEHALPADGYVKEQTWVTNKLIDSHKTYNIYVRDYEDGVLFSWTRANNGNSYSFFYDNFDPSVAGWYELTLEAAKVGDLKGDVSIQVHAGKYYYADDRPQPQRLLDVVSVGSDKVEPQTIRVFLRPGENVSVHCFHKDNFREKNPKRGVYIKQMTARGPLQDAWPPSRYGMLFGDLPLEMNSSRGTNAKHGDSRSLANASGYQSNTGQPAATDLPHDSNPKRERGTKQDAKRSIADPSGYQSNTGQPAATDLPHDSNPKRERGTKQDAKRTIADPSGYQSNTGQPAATDFQHDSNPKRERGTKQDAKRSIADPSGYQSNTGQPAATHLPHDSNPKRERGTKQDAKSSIADPSGYQSNTGQPAATALPHDSNPKRERGTKQDAERTIADPSGYQSTLKQIGGSVTVSSFQVGMEKEKMQDGSNRTFWHTRFKPTLAEPPHFVILHNPNRHTIEGLSYATWTGGNGNGQIEKFEINASEDGRNWSDSIASGYLETRLANEQRIPFSVATNAPFLKFIATQSYSIDGRSLASIGKLDVITSLDEELPKSKVLIESDRIEDIKTVIRRFAGRAFSSDLSDSELRPYFDVTEAALRRDGNFIEAAKTGFKAVICSPRFLIAPGEHSSEQLSRNATLARAMWMSVPDTQTRGSNLELRDRIAKMLMDRRSDRMFESLCNQWLNLRSWNNVPPSLKLYPRYDDLLEFYLPLETKRYLAHLIRENRPVSELIDSDYSFLNQRLANHYGIDAVTGQRLRLVSFGPDIPRGGLLTMGSVLKVTTDGFATSPILRGAWISKNIVGTPLSPPPETVKAIEPNHGADPASLREQIANHKNSESCYACHKSIDPYGFALETFDSTGQWRTKYSTEIPHQGTFTFRLHGYFKKTSNIDAAGEIDDQEFANVFGLKKLLVTNERKIAYNFAKKFFEYTNGYQPSLEQRLDLLEMIDPKGCRMRDLVTDVLVYSTGGDAGKARK